MTCPSTSGTAGSSYGKGAGARAFSYRSERGAGGKVLGSDSKGFGVHTTPWFASRLLARLLAASALMATCTSQSAQTGERSGLCGRDHGPWPHSPVHRGQPVVRCLLVGSCANCSGCRPGVCTVCLQCTPAPTPDPHPPCSNICRLDGSPPNNGTVNGKFIFSGDNSQDPKHVTAPYK